MRLEEVLPALRDSWSIRRESLPSNHLLILKGDTLYFKDAVNGATMKTYLAGDDLLAEDWIIIARG